MMWHRMPEVDADTRLSNFMYWLIHLACQPRWTIKDTQVEFPREGWIYRLTFQEDADGVFSIFMRAYQSGTRWSTNRIFASVDELVEYLDASWGITREAGI